MAITMRRGLYEDLNTDKLMPGEWAVVLANDPLCTDGKSAYICFSAGDTKRMATYEDMVEQFGDMTDDIIKQITDDVNAVIVIANTAADHANAVAEDLIARRESGDFKGEKGDPGITQLLQGQFAFRKENGELHMYYHEGDTLPNFTKTDDGYFIQIIGGEMV